MCSYITVAGSAASGCNPSEGIAMISLYMLSLKMALIPDCTCVYSSSYSIASQIHIHSLLQLFQRMGGIQPSKSASMQTICTATGCRVVLLPAPLLSPCLRQRLSKFDSYIDVLKLLFSFLSYYIANSHTFEVSICCNL